MPTYLLHGFRWQRANIRIFVILQNVDDAAPDWIVQPASAQSLLETFHATFDFLPAVANDASLPSDTSTTSAAPSALAAQDGYAVRLVEEFDPTDLETPTAPHAYVADHVVAIDRSTSVTAAMAAYEGREKTGGHPPDWLGRLRDQLQPDEAVGWYVVVNGDEQRAWEGGGGGGEVDGYDEYNEHEYDGYDGYDGYDEDNNYDRHGYERDDEHPPEWPMTASVTASMTASSMATVTTTASSSPSPLSRRETARRQLRHELGGFSAADGGLGEHEHTVHGVATEAAAAVAAARAERAERAEREAREALRAAAPPPPNAPPPPPPPPLAGSPAARKQRAAAGDGPRPPSSGGLQRLLRSRSRSRSQSDAREPWKDQKEQKEQQSQRGRDQKDPSQKEPQHMHQPPPSPPSTAQPVRRKKSVDLRPKTPTSLRRLFGRSKADDPPR